MSDIAIKVEGLSKQYEIGRLQRRHDTLRDRIADARVFNLFKRNGNGLLSSDLSHRDTIWALKNVSFEVKRGEVIGIIGRNGAGKSTLLKILSRITEPTEGYADIVGRVGSLLEVGTGFHPELTGRENIYLNGSILGMKRAEIQSKFDEIVAFTEIEKFIDTPVKHYSTGMYVRLAFAVAAHLETEILLVDEVLSVGDVAFQKKCLGKMGDVAKEGRTVLLVTHDMGRVVQLCRSGVLLNSGAIEIAGEMTELVATYLSENPGATESFADLTGRDRSGEGTARFKSVELFCGSEPCSTFSFGSPLTLKLEIEVCEHLGSPPLQIVICTSDGVPVHDLHNWNEGCFWTADAGTHEFSITIPCLRMYPGSYTIDLWLGDQKQNRIDYVKNAISFRLVQKPDSEIARPLNRADGLVFQSSEWTHAGG